MNKNKKILLALGALGATVVMLPMFAAFEAHVINVTAQIENALGVSTNSIDFGTVFPQEHLDQPLTVALSQSFLDEDRVDDVEYFIRQKPKCGITTNNGQSLVENSTVTGHVFVGTAPVDPTHTFFQGEGYYVDCGVTPTLTEGQTFGMLPSLCEYISKEDDETPDNDGSLASFHQPFVIDGENIDWNDTPGRLAKSDQDTEDIWTIDLAVPCFGGFCAQDWADFVTGINPDANPDDFTQPIENEHKVFGCDLWVEVNGVSESEGGEDGTTITVNKVVTNDDGGTAVAGDFTLSIAGIGTVTNGVATNVAPGNYDVNETGVAGYQGTFSGDCDADGDVTIADGQDLVCTITNNDIAPSITLNKVVVGSEADANTFGMQVNGTPVSNGGSISVDANTNLSITETNAAGYSTAITGTGCPASLGEAFQMDLAESITCTVTNTLIAT